MTRSRWALAVCLALVAPAPAVAAPHRTTLDAEREIVENVGGYGCSTESVTMNLPYPPRETWPGPGDWLEGLAFVRDVQTQGTRVTWTVGPSAEACATQPGGDDVYWETGDASFGASFRGRLYVVRATRRNGVRSVAGVRTRWTGRQGPSIRRVKRALGRPTDLRGGWGKDVCYARWARMGLRIVFVNFGGKPACKAGFFQTAQIAGRNAGKWAVLIDGYRGTPVVPGTSLRYLRNEELVTYNYFNEVWALSQDWLPYGEAGYYSTVGARLAYSDDWDGSNPVRGFDLYVGAGGD